MKRNAMHANLRRSIFRSLGRYIAIAMIIALGAGLFVGLRMTKADMVATGQRYMDQQNMFDLRIMSSYGWAKDQLSEFAALEGVTDAEGLYYQDLVARQDRKGAEDAVYRFYTIPETVNRLVLLEGRMPEGPNECLADGYHNDESILGTRVTVSSLNEPDSLDTLTTRVFTVVGYVSTPLYMDMNRGTTSVGNGSIENYFFVPREAFDVDYYTEIHLTLPGTSPIYSGAYKDAMNSASDALEPRLTILAQERFDGIRQEAEDAYGEGWMEYQDGLNAYYEGKHQAYGELREAYQELLDGEQTLLDSEAQLRDGERKIAGARETIRQNKELLAQSRMELENAREDACQQMAQVQQELDANKQTVEENLNLVNNGIAQIDSGLEELNAGIIQLEDGLAQLDDGIAQMETLVGIIDGAVNAINEMLEPILNGEIIDDALKERLLAKLAEYNAQRDAYVAQLEELKAQRAGYAAQLQSLYETRSSLLAQREELEANRQTLLEAQAAIEAGYLELAQQREAMELQLAGALAQIEAGEAQILEAEQQLASQSWTLTLGWEKLEEGKQELAEGWQSYREGRDEAEAELADARQTLADARGELADARQTIDNMEENDLFLLDRTSNLGYSSLDSSSDIVEGVSRVFPAFFLLVAALVCITTMTRMVDEERTQIGTLKAMGYSNNAIIRKYMLYAGSSAIVGCGLGVFAGSAVFPAILWEAYKIMLFITDDIVLTFDWGLCLLVVGSYTLVELAVTWYCCRRSLEEVPAELIRPKVPTAGKQLLFEKLPFWGKVSFLNKVAVRNIFRYRQRLAMMLVGIGGCTALLLTGFGLRDSIVNIVDFQFDDITTYDMSVYFTEGQTEQQRQKFEADIGPYASGLMFYHQTSVDLETEDETRSIYMIAAGEGMQNFIDLHSGTQPIAMPGENEAVLSVGVAEAMDIALGDAILLRNSDLEVLNLTVSGIYDNYVYNYAIVSPQTLVSQWGREPEQQMAFVTIAQGQDAHQVSAEITAREGVMNVSVSQDLAGMVRNMMEALDLVVVVIVFCAALLAATVLYNLTNININERIREIATIKVLGFRAMETAMYIFKENLVLSVMGTAVGLGLGKLLLEFVMSQIKIDFVWFQARILLPSYLWSVVLTILTTLLVDFIFYYKLEKINMAEALKSVE